MKKSKLVVFSPSFYLIVCCLITNPSIGQINQSSGSPTIAASSLDARADALLEMMSQAISNVDPGTPTYIPGDEKTMAEVLMDFKTSIESDPGNEIIVSSAIARLQNAYMPNAKDAYQYSSSEDRGRTLADSRAVTAFYRAIARYQELAVQRRGLEAQEPVHDAEVISVDIASLKSSAELGDASAQGKLGKMYASGDGLPQDYKVAAVWFERAAIQGLPSAQNDIGALYHAGRGVSQDFEKAAVYYGLAAQQGSGYAALNMGGLFYMGQGVQRDLAQAAYWFTLAANSDDSSASKLGLLWSERVRESAQLILDRQEPFDSESEFGKGVTVGLIFLAIALALGGGNDGNGFTSNSGQQKFTPYDICSGFGATMKACGG